MDISRIQLIVSATWIFVLTIAWSLPTKIPKTIVNLSDEDEEVLRSVLNTASSPLFEGDLLDIEPNINMSTQGQSYTASSKSTWPKARIPYAIRWKGAGSMEGAEDFVNVLLAAIGEIQDKTCVRFVAKESTDDNYVMFVSGPGCSSYPGMQLGSQYVIFDTRANGCRSNRKILHELMHTIGFFHEMSRDDRDEYVEVDTTNLKEGTEKNFQKYRDRIDTRGLPFDMDSVMMYEPNDFAKDPKKWTIRARDPSKTIAASQHLTDLDILSVNMQYQCPGKRTVQHLGQPCPSRTNVYQFNAHCYFISPDEELVTYEDAKKSCADKDAQIAAFSEILLGPFTNLTVTTADRFSSNIFWIKNGTQTTSGSSEDTSDRKCMVLLPGPLMKENDNCDDFNNYICVY